MADARDLEFTYSLIDRVFRLSMGELADFSGAKYDGDFSLSLEEAQRRKHEYVAEQIGSGPRGGCSTSAAAGARCLTSSAAGARRRRGDALLGPGRGLPAPRARRAPAATRARSPARRSDRSTQSRASARSSTSARRRSYRAGTPGGHLPRAVRQRRRHARRERRALLPADDGLRPQHDPARAGRTSRRRATPTPGTSRS